MREPTNSITVGPRTNPWIPDFYELGYDVKRDITAGRFVPSGAKNLQRTFTMTLTTHDQSLAHIGASIDFHGRTSRTESAGIDVRRPVRRCGPGYLKMTPGLPVFWKIGVADFPDPEPGTTYTLTCTLKQTNTAPTPALFMPSAYVTGARIAEPIIGTNSVNSSATKVRPDRSP